VQLGHIENQIFITYLLLITQSMSI